MSKQVIKALLIEGNPGDVRLIKEMLAGTEAAHPAVSDFEFIHADRLSTGLQRLGAEDIDIILLDLSLSDSQGVETFLQVQTQAPEIPIVVLTDLDNEAVAAKAVDAGAQDYLTKGELNSNLLWRAIRYAIARKQAEENLQQKLAELTLLNTIATAATKSAQKNDLLENVIQIMRKTFYSDYFGVGLVDETGAGIHGYYAYQGSDRAFNEITTLLEQGVTGRVIATGQPWRIADINQEPAYMELNPNTRSELCVPLKLGARVIGVINVESSRLAAFSEADEQFLVAVAGQLAMALDRLHFFEATQRRAAELEALVEVSSALRQATNRADMLPVILDQVRHLLQADGVAMAIHDPNSDEIVMELARGSHAHLTGLRIPSDQGVSGRVIAIGQPYVNDDVRTDPQLFRPDPINSPMAVACIPLIARKQTMGVLWVNRKTPIIQPEVRLLTAIADIAANAIQRVTLYEATQHHVQRLTALRQIDLAITTNLQLQVVLEVLLEQVTAQLKVDAADVLLLDSESQLLEYAAGRGLHAKAFTQVRLRLGESHAGRAAREQKIVNVPDLSRDTGSPARAQSLLAEGFLTYYGVPLVAKGEVEGVLEIFHRASLDPSHEWLEFLEALSAQAAIAIENARLFEETQAQAHQLEQILDSVPEGVLLLDANQRLILANPIAREYLKILTPDEDRDRLTHLAERSLTELIQPAANGLGRELELFGPPHRIFELEARPLNTEIQAGGWVLVIREVTRERNIQQQAQLQERLAAVGQLAAGITHDFNNILAIIIGVAELTRFQISNIYSIEETLDRVIEQGNRAAHLTRQILDFSRQTFAERQKLDLMSLIEEILKLLKRIISEDIQISLETESGQEAYLINANPVQIQQVVTNLALNAQDAMPSGGVLTFGLSRLTLNPGQPPPCPELSPGEWIVLAVSDTGTGIAPQNLPHLFEPFFTTKTEEKGTGLGLAQVYGLVKQNDGEIEVSSQEENGTMFTIYLPAVAPALPGKRLSPKAPEEMPRGQGELILLAEDDSNVCWVAAAMLESLGYRVLTTSNGRHALEVYHEHQDEIALVLTDLRMPEMGGVALSQALQKKNPALKVIAMTGYPLENNANELLTQNFVKWIQKPLSTLSLAQAVSEMLKEADLKKVIKN